MPTRSKSQLADIRGDGGGGSGVPRAGFEPPRGSWDFYISLRWRRPQGTRNTPDNFGSAAGGFTQAPGGRVGSKLESVEFPAFGLCPLVRPIGPAHWAWPKSHPETTTYHAGASGRRMCDNPNFWAGEYCKELLAVNRGSEHQLMPLQVCARVISKVKYANKNQGDASRQVRVDSHVILHPGFRMHSAPAGTNVSYELKCAVSCFFPLRPTGAVRLPSRWLLPPTSIPFERQSPLRNFTLCCRPVYLAVKRDVNWLITEASELEVGKRLCQKHCVNQSYKMHTWDTGSCDDGIVEAAKFYKKILAICADMMDTSVCCALSTEISKNISDKQTIIIRHNLTTCLLCLCLGSLESAMEDKDGCRIFCE